MSSDHQWKATNVYNYTVESEESEIKYIRSLGQNNLLKIQSYEYTKHVTK